MSDRTANEIKTESESNQQDVGDAPAAAAASSDLNEKYEALKIAANAVLLEYEQAYKRIIGKLSAEHLEPFAKILLEREQTKLVTEEAAAVLQENLLKYLPEKLNEFWKNFLVIEQLAKLEMLKEECEQYKGINWNINALSPDERVRPIRMHLKKMRLLFMQKKVEQQHEELQNLGSIIEANRQLVREVALKRERLTEAMHKRSENLPLLKDDLLKMQNAAWESI